MTASTRRSDWRLLAACYALWLALIVGVGWTLSQAHTLLLELSLEFRLNPWAARAIRQLSLPLLGLFWLIFIFWLEHHFRVGVHQGRFAIRAIRVTGGVIGALLVIMVIRWFVA
mgnify:CR=1 FL=1|jgi:hypothetical protein